MQRSTSLVIKNLPPALTQNDKEEFLRILGATKVRCPPDRGRCRGGLVFANFGSREEAEHALSKLHQREVLGSVLIVEFAKERDAPDLPKESDFPPFRAKAEEVVKPLEEERKQDASDFAKELHCLCPTLGLSYLPSPLLKYRYPPPSVPVLTNITHALISVPKFYTQVLHLMNKMNLPAPFGPVTPQPPLLLSHEDQEQVPADKLEVEKMDTDTEESEMESDAEDVKMEMPSGLEQPKKESGKVKKKKKQPRLQQLLAQVPASRPTEQRTAPSEVFDSVDVNIDSQKKIQFNINPSLESGQAINPEGIEVSDFGLIEAFKPSASNLEEAGDSEKEMEQQEGAAFIPLRELKHKRVSSREMKTMSVFRNYSTGEPTVRLYIKNLARQVEEKDLRYVFGRFIDWDLETDKNMFDIRLMKEGRMKGQAFVTLANEKQAADAVRETNGFVLHTKPMVVQFARSAKVKDQGVKPTN